MGNIRRQFRVSAAAFPGIFGERRSLKPVNDVVVHARMLWRLRHKLAQQRHRFHAAFARSFFRQHEAAHRVQRQVGLGFHLFGIGRHDRAQAADVRIVRIFHIRIAARRDGCNVQALQRRRFAGNRAQLQRFPGGVHRPLHSARWIDARAGCGSGRR
jgi:hypothetical protein